jgi:hypothetical protein
MKIKDLLEIQSIIEKRKVPCDMNGDLNQHYSTSKKEYIDILDMDLIHLVRSYNKILSHDKIIMKRKVWTSEEMEKARELLKKHSYATVGKILHRSKNSVVGQFYREKIFNGYTPPPDSKFTRKKEKNIYIDF